MTPQLGVLVSCMGYRNADLVADMARTVDHLSGGRVVLGLGAGWYQEEHEDYGYEFEGPGARIDALETGLGRVRDRLTKLAPAPLGPLPLMVGGGGERRTLRLVAEYADMWNVVLSEPEEFRSKNDILTAWCVRLGRDPRAVERSVLINDPSCFGRANEFAEVGADHVIIPIGDPFSFEPARELIRTAAS